MTLAAPLTSAPSASTTPELFSLTTVLSLAATVAIVLSAYLTSRVLLPASTSTKLRTLYIWHLADALCHFILEGSFLYNCFFVYADVASSFTASATYPGPASLGPARFGHFLGRADRAYGPAHGANPFAKLWQEYAKADARWGGADLGVISLELLTVGLAGPCALYVAELIRRGAGSASSGAGVGAGTGQLTARMWFWATMLATGELYGGFMTFCPEWLSGNTNLDGSNWMYMWLYLVFFNMLWVGFPIWVLWEALGSMKGAFLVAEKVALGAKGKKVN